MSIDNMKQIKYKGKYIETSEEKIHTHTYERTALIPNVHVLPIRDNKILLINEFKTHEKKARWKLVTGWAEKTNKNLLEHAQEELAEEVGMKADLWKEFFNADTPNGTVNLNTHYFVCRNISILDHKIENPDTGEVLGFEWFTYEDIWMMINEGLMYPEQSTLVALWYLRSLNN